MLVAHIQASYLNLNKEVIKKSPNDVYHTVVKSYTTLQYVEDVGNHSCCFNSIDIHNQASKCLSFNLSPSDFFG